MERFFLPTVKTLTPKHLILSSLLLASSFSLLKANPQNEASTTISNSLQRSVEHDSLRLKNPEILSNSILNKQTEDDRFWLTMIVPINLEIMTAIVYFEGGNDGYANDDSDAAQSSDEIYSIVDEHQLCIQGKAPFDNTDVVKLGIRAFTPGTHTITIYAKEGIFRNNQIIYLYDRKLGKIHNLTTSNYSFYTEPGEYNSRFEIIYKPVGFIKKTFSGSKAVQVVKQNQSVFVQSKQERISKIEVFNMNGVSLLKKDNIQAKKFTLPLQNAEKEILFLLIETESGEVQFEQIIY